MKLFGRLVLAVVATSVSCSDVDADGTGSGSDGTTGGSGSGGTSGETSGEPDYCGAETTTVITDLDAMLPGFDRSVNDILFQASGSYTGTMTWGPEDPIIVFAHANTTADVTFTLTHTGEVRLTEVANLGGDASASEGASYSCSNELEIEMSLDYSTSDGLLDEVLSVELSLASHEFDPILSLPTFTRTLDLDNRDGDLSTADFELAGSATMREVFLRGRFSEDGTARGTLETIADLNGGSRQVAPGNWNASR
jgi:hypothetical protein